MKKMKLEISDDLKLHLSKMREILAGISSEDDSISSPSQGCGEQCMITCAYYCQNNCEDTCGGTCSDFFAKMCRHLVVF